MQDLSKWSYADEFTPHEAACLIVGLDPTNTHKDLRVAHLMRRMEKAYRCKLDHVREEVWRERENEDLAAWREDYAPEAEFGPLRSMKLEASLYAWVFQGSEEIKDWLNDEEACAFHKQRFSKSALATWTSSIGLKTAFAFTSDPNPDAEFKRAPVAEVGNSGEIRFGRHQTRWLRKLAAASDRFWSLYDPDDHTTAPTAETVIKWLTEQGVSERMAEVMASILRADGLPVGRR
jgi:hypothetical protein